MKSGKAIIKVRPYVESFDMDETGCPINGHPLTVKEANALAKSLMVAEKKQRNFLNPKAAVAQKCCFPQNR